MVVFSLGAGLKTAGLHGMQNKLPGGPGPSILIRPVILSQAELGSDDGRRVGASSLVVRVFFFILLSPVLDGFGQLLSSALSTV